MVVNLPIPLSSINVGNTSSLSQAQKVPVQTREYKTVADVRRRPGTTIVRTEHESSLTNRAKRGTLVLDYNGVAEEA